MKKITLFTTLLITALTYGQSYSTGTVNLTTNRSVQFDVNTVTDVVTMTLERPTNSWLGVAPGVVAGMGMGNLNDECITFSSGGLEDRSMLAGVGLPPLDATNEWTVISNTTSGSQNILVATRARDTGNPTDYVFPSSASTFSILYGFGTSAAFGYHGFGNYGAQMANLTLSTEQFDDNLTFKIYPNPTADKLFLNFNNFHENTKVEIYNILSRKIFETNSNLTSLEIDVSAFNSGVYILKVSNSGKSVVKRFIRN